MEIFLDTFDIAAIEKYQHIIKGITTNPVIIKQYCASFDEFSSKLKSIQTSFPHLLINLQVTQETASEMVKEAEKLMKYGTQIIIKVPLTLEGMKALKEIAKTGVKTNGTLCFSLFQAKLAQSLGATYISPFLGRMQDAQVDIANFMSSLNTIIDKSVILAASVRNIGHVEIAMATSKAITLNEVVLDKLFAMPLLKDGHDLFKKAKSFELMK
jgi:transaldolase